MLEAGQPLAHGRGPAGSGREIDNHLSVHSGRPEIVDQHRAPAFSRQRTDLSACHGHGPIQHHEGCLSRANDRRSVVLEKAAYGAIIDPEDGICTELLPQRQAAPGMSEAKPRAPLKHDFHKRLAGPRKNRARRG